jgi:hypothetical protein
MPGFLIIIVCRQIRWSTEYCPNLALSTVVVEWSPVIDRDSETYQDEFKRSVHNLSIEY